MRKIALIFAYLLLTVIVTAQPNNAYLKNVTMPSPQAASLGKYGDIPIGYYTGVPNVGIPIHTLSEGPLNLPVSLSYHASGVKVAETPSWVGLNWTLSAGGMISRTMQSFRDEEGTAGWLNSAAIPDKNFDYCGFYSHVFTGDKDSEPDIFSFSFPGGSGKFYFKKNGTAVLVPIQQLKVTPLFDSSEPYLKGFIITTPDGTKYHFGNTGTGNIAHESSIGGGGDMQEHVSGWYLTRVESADGNYQINLNYTDECSQTDYRPSTIGCDGAAPNGQALGNLSRKNTFVKGKRLSSITTSSETITFFANTIRQDLDVYPVAPFNTQKPKALDSLTIVSGTFKKRFDFAYSYWKDNSTDSISTGSIMANKRLKLLSVQERGKNNTIINTPWTFEYFTKSGNVDFLPHRLSRSVDHWGFYNGANNGSYNESTPNIPGLQTGTCLDGGSCLSNTYSYPGLSDRETNESAMKYGTLKKVNYPTGGYTEFDFEANDYYSSATVQKKKTLLSIDHNFTGGGICGSITSVSNPLPSVQFTSTELSTTDPNKAVYTLNFKPANCNCLNSQVSVEITAFSYPGHVLVATSGQFQISCTSGAVTYTNALKTLMPALTPGTNYTFEIQGVSAAARFYVTRPESVPAGNIKVGGLRVKQIITHDGLNAANNIIRNYTYRDSITTANSSGQLYNVPTYVHSYTWFPCTGSNCGSVCAPGACPQYQLSSGGCNVSFYENSIVPLGSFEGYHIGYKHVKEEFNGNGYKTYTYTTETAIANQFPNPPAPARILAGNLIHAVTRNSTGTLISSESHQANSDNYTYSTDVMYKKMANNCGSFLTTYNIRTRPYREASVKNVLDGVETKVTYTYPANTSYDIINNHLFPSSQSTINSDGKTHLTEYKYPYESETGNATIMADLKGRYIIADPWKTVIKVDGTEVDGTETEYAWYNTSGVRQLSQGTNFPRIYRYYNYEKTWTAGTLTGPGKTLRGTIDSYNNKGLPASFTAANWLPETYSWNTNGLIASKTYNGYTTTYDYHTGTRLVSKITQPDGQESWFDYDALMRVSKAWTRPSTVGSKTTANVTTDYDYRYKGQTTPSNSMGENYVKTITTFASAPGGGGTSGLTTKEVYQYMDGIGRSYQMVNRKQSPASKDVVLYTTYDKWGRTVRQYNPVESVNNTGAKIAEPTSSPYTISEYYSDPLSRHWKVTPPSWYATEYTYGTNAGSEVLLNHTTPTYFAANSLTKTTVKDPDNKQVITYQDKQGRTILTKRTDTGGSGPANTYNIYDDKSRLTKVIPPGSTFASTTLNFEYTYDPADNMLTKKVPDAALVTMKYNVRDQLVLEQDGNLAALSTPKWRCIQYDDFGRVIKTGLFSDTIPSPIPTTQPPTEVYTENVYGTTGIDKGKIKITKVKVFDTGGTWLQTTNTFDAFGRISSSTGNNYLIPTDFSAETMSYIYDYADNVLKDTRVSKKTSSASYTLTQTHNFDHWGRNTLNTHQVGSGTVHNISQLNYNWKDQLIERNIGKIPTKPNYLQSLDYRYNNQGWLLSINQETLFGNNTGFVACNNTQNMPNPGATYATPDSSDLFFLNLRYDTLQSGLSGTTCKNGNISQVIWRVRGRERQAYSLTYDYLDRMTAARYDNMADAGTVNNTNAWNENLSYDIRGNIITLSRNGKYKTTSGATCWTDGQIDNLTYTYNSNTNKLQKITDVSPAASRKYGWHNVVSAPSTYAYGYDDNGNMTFDPYKNLGVEYNFLNLPKKMTFTNDTTGAEYTLDILYDGSGRKLRKTVKSAGMLQYTQDYVGGIEYRTTSAVSLSLESIAHGEGRVFNANVGTTSADALRYEYSIRDHLGNTRLTFTDKSSDGKVDLITGVNNEVLQENHYYPFGLVMNGPWMNDAAIDNKYQYNGKEINDDFGLGWNDYGARWYDATVGRWWSVDLMLGKTQDFSPFVYVDNNPFSFTDPTGMFGVSYGAAGYSSLSDYFGNKNAEYEAGVKSANENRQEKRNLTVYYTNAANLSAAKIAGIFYNASEIFRKNGLKKNLIFNQVTNKEAKKYKSTTQAFLAIINQTDYVYDKEKGYKESLHPGNTADNGDGTIGVYDEGAQRYSTPWQSWVTLGCSKVQNHPNQEYAAGYLAAHEILHQMLIHASFAKYGNTKQLNGHSGGAWGDNLNKDGQVTNIPDGPKKQLQKAEQIRSDQLKWINEYFGN